MILLNNDITILLNYDIMIYFLFLIEKKNFFNNNFLYLYFYLFILLIFNSILL